MYVKGLRYDSSTLGRWLNRDRVGEEGGLGLYAFLGNSSVGSVDFLGNYGLGCCGSDTYVLEFEGCCGKGARAEVYDLWSQGCCGDKVYESKSHCCEKNVVVEKVAIWVCHRPRDQAWYTLPFAFHHWYVCCGSGPNDPPCYGNPHNKARKGDPMETEHKRTGKCSQEKVCPDCRKKKCENPTAPCNFSTLWYNCKDWATLECEDPAWSGGP